MAETSLPANLLAEFEDMKRRLHALETAPRATETSIDEGSFEVLDEAGNTVTVQGAIGDAYGIYVRHPDTGIYLFYADTEMGLAAPYPPLQVVDPNEFIAVTSGAFVTTWVAKTEQLRADAVKVRVGWGADASTPGELRVAIAGGFGNGETAEVALTAGTTGNAEFNWRHGVTLGVGPIWFLIEARRVSGAGNVNIYTPTVYEGGSEFFGATVAGV